MTDPPHYTFRLPKLNIHIDRGVPILMHGGRSGKHAVASSKELANVDAMKQVQVLTLCLSSETLSQLYTIWGLAKLN